MRRTWEVDPMFSYRPLGIALLAGIALTAFFAGPARAQVDLAPNGLPYTYQPYSPWLY
jgi:hypothetical protein